jgi:hypothetical protein
MAEDPATQTANLKIADDSQPREVAGEVGSGKSERPTADRDTTARSSAQSDVRGPVTLSARVNLWSTILTGLTAVIALGLSLITYLQLNSRAEINMAMPNKIVVWSDQGTRQAYFNVVIKPTFNVDKKTDVAAAVTDAILELEAPTGGNQQPMTLRWSDQVEIRDDEKGAYKRIWRDNPEPFLVTPDAREGRAMEFTLYATSDKLNIVAGRWNAHLTVQRRHQSPLTRNFCINISDEIAGSLNDAIKQKEGWSGLRILGDSTPNGPQIEAEKGNDDCYQPF